MITPRHDRKEPRGWIDLFLAMKGWLALIAGVIAVVLTFVSVRDYKNAQRLAVDSAWTQAVITDKRISRNDDSDSYHAMFRYTVDGQDYVKERNVGRAFYMQHATGQSVPIKYWRAGPKLFEFREGQTKGAAVGMQVAAGVAGLVALGAVWFPGARTNAAILSRRYGHRTTATISAIVEIKKSGRPTGRGYMRFETSDGRRGESLDHRIGKLHALRMGTQIVVFVRDNDVWWEGDVGPRARLLSRLPKVPLRPRE